MERNVLEEIVSWARERDDIRTVILCGSRADPSRIDFQVTTRKPSEGFSLNEPHRLLIDKDQQAASLPPAPRAKTVQRPTEHDFCDRVNAFWWDSIYVAKALVRGELNFAKYMLDSMLRFGMIRPMLDWYVGCARGDG